MNLSVFGGLYLAALEHLSYLIGLEVARMWCKVPEYSGSLPGSCVYTPSGMGKKSEGV